ncbi:MAG: hypothetical protein RL653_1878, partial [Pseudomonadota bacterium]
EGYGERGMAHLFEHMLFKRTRKFRSVKEELSRLGGAANGTTFYDRTNFYEYFPSDDAHLDRALELEADRLRYAFISREELATEMTVVRNELEMGENDPATVTEQRLMSAAFLWHNYGNHVIGPRSDIEQVPSDRLLAWYETWYQPDNAVLFIAGRFDERKVLRSVARHFARIPRPRRKLPDTWTTEPTQDGENSVTVRRAGGIPLLFAAYHVPAATDPDFPALLVAASVLGDAPAGRLHRGLVETRKASAVECSVLPLREPGALTCNARLEAGGAAAPARDALLATLEAPGPVSDEEVARARQAVARRYEDLQNDSARLGLELSEYAALGDWRMLFLVRDRAAAVTREDVSRVLGRYLQPANRTLAEYVPTGNPTRAEIPPRVEPSVALRGYVGRAAVSAGESFDPSPENIDARTTRVDLPSGARLALLQKRTRGEVVRMVLRLSVGDEASLQGRGVAGAAAARMLLRGTERLSRQQVTDLLDAWGATVDVSWSQQLLRVTLEVPRSNLKEALDLLAECIQRPALDPRQFEELRRAVLTELASQQDDPIALGSRELLRRIQPFPAGHPLYEPSFAEERAAWNALGVDQLRAFHRELYGAQGLRVALVGDFDAGEVRGWLTQHWGAWRSPRPYVRIPVPLGTTPAGGLEHLDTPDKAMTFLGAALTLPLQDTHPDYPALQVADYLLGGGFMQGRIPARLREKEGLSYGAGTQLTVAALDPAGAWMGYASSAPENAAKVEQGFREEFIRAVEGGYTEEEFRRAVDAMLRERSAYRAMDGWVADRLATGLELDRPLAFDAAQDAAVRKLTVQQVNAAFQRHVNPRRMFYLQAGPVRAGGSPR